MIGYLRTLAMFYRRHLRVQPLRELMAVGGVAAGVALLFAVQVAHKSVTGSFQELSRGLAGRSTLEVASRGSAGFDAHVAEQIERMSGVRRVAPLLEQPIVAVGPHGRRALTLVGATEQITPLGGGVSSAFERAGEGAQRGLLILTAPVARAIGAMVGSEVRVFVGERSEHLAVDAVVPGSKLGAVVDSPIAAAPLAVVQALAELPGRVSRVLIEVRRGREAAVRKALLRRFGAQLNVRGVSVEAQLLDSAAGPEKQVTLLFSAISLVAGIILAFNALLLASEERRKFIANLTEIGTPDLMIVASLAFDALILGAAGALLGLLLGDLVSVYAYRSIPGYIAAAFAIGGQRVVGTQTVAIALGGGVIAAFAAAALPALAILRGSATDSAEDDGRTLSLVRRLRVSEWVIFGSGLCLTAACVVLSIVEPATTVAALVGLVVGLVTCLPVAARYLLGLAQRAWRESGDPAARLSIAELRTTPARSVALLATGTVAAFLMVLIGGSVGDVRQAARTGATDLLSSASLWIKPGGPENVYTTQRFAYAATKRNLEQIPTVSAVLPWRDAFLDLPRRRVWVLGVPPAVRNQIAPSQLIEGSLRRADRLLQAGGWVAMSQPIAREMHLRIGDPVPLPTPSGVRRMRLAATIANYGWLPGAIVMNADDQARFWRDSAATELAVSLTTGTDVSRGKEAIERALPGNTALSVQTVAERRAEVSAVLGSTLSRLNDTTFVVLIVTITSVIALMLAAIWQRRGRLNSLTAIGMSSLQFARLVSYESGLVLLSGCVIGTVSGLLGQYLIDGWLHETTGASVEYSPAWLVGARTFVLIAAICVLASLVAVVQTARSNRREAFSIE